MGLGLGEGEAQESPRIIYFRQTEHWPERQSLGIALPGWGSRRDGQGRPRDPGITALMAQDFSEKSWLPYWMGKGTMGKKEREFPAACPGPVGTEQGHGCTCYFSLLLLTPESTGMPTEQRLEESQVLIPSSFPNSPV